MKEPKRKINLKNLNSKLLVFNAVVLAAFFAVQMIITVTMGTKTQEISVLREQKNGSTSHNTVPPDIEGEQKGDRFEKEVGRAMLSLLSKRNYPRQTEPYRETGHHYGLSG